MYRHAGSTRDELQELEEKIAKTKLSKEAREKATNELKKLRQMSPMSAEATVVRNYLDWLLGIPWGKKSKVKYDLNFAQESEETKKLYGIDRPETKDFGQQMLAARRMVERGDRKSTRLNSSHG